jgi:hypothetical protein
VRKEGGVIMWVGSARKVADLSRCFDINERQKFVI